VASRSFARNVSAVNARPAQPTFASRAKPWRPVTIREDVHRKFVAIMTRANRAHRAHLRALQRNPVYAGSRRVERSSRMRLIV